MQFLWKDILEVYRSCLIIDNVCFLRRCGAVLAVNVCTDMGGADV